VRDERKAAAARAESRRNADIDIDGHDFRVVPFAVIGVFYSIT
jgi:hypothetical protein